ncbi:hypothetical protein CEP88_19790 [Roseobacter denitrificans]|uniref:Uncharacterized protein n=1 Tax=Roseobacter denitrificans (strain ATCC 33942 / OCh 114) TaxID=375451 RepID=Q168H1_ROSDO|nr:hypothetical protein [Roseobacter denitrificans]ABG31622.1 hypothetical protein RD1_2019 [Roseobacter denitrificans OCh 114]AVL54605.1 hypothetical protein CEP88_19790 [Roseobacter denitrificans]SFF89178.1 hypothetical protein SAMN05443635_103209 [Roseobacter denitrificans OCh 114]
MFDNLNRLDLTSKDIDMIEAALHTQKKILSVQSAAGGTGARRKLNEIKQLMKRVGRARAAQNGNAAPSWAQMARMMLTGQKTSG